MSKREMDDAGVALVVTAALVFAFAGWVVARPVEPPASVGSTLRPDADSKEPPVVVVLGDSFTGGSAMSSGPTWFEQVADIEDWIGYNESIGGTGYINGDRRKPPFPERAEAIAAEYDEPDIIIVQGGLNDLGNPTTQIAEAMDKTLTTLDEAFPEAELAALSLFSPHGMSDRVEDLRDAQREVAQAHDATFVDVSRLFLGGDAGLIGQDGTHPTDAGHRHIAAAVAPRLAEITTPR